MIKVTVALLSFLLFVNLFGQRQHKNLVTCAFDQESLKSIFNELSEMTGFYFSYNTDILPKGNIFTITAKDEPIGAFLSNLLVGTGVTYSFYKNQIILNYQNPETIKDKNGVTFSIQGTVTDSNNHPIQDVNIFLDGTTIGTFTNENGDYLIDEIPVGYYNIVFSHTTFKTGIYAIKEYNGGDRIQNHEAIEQPVILEDIEVKSTKIDEENMEWIIHYIDFKEELLGTSSMAIDCHITNPTVLSIENQNDTIHVSNQEPIRIINQSLGYEISYLIDEYSQYEEELMFRGGVKFSNLQSYSKKESKGWDKNRKKAYLGSFNHFKRALLQGDLKKQGFSIYSLKNLEYPAKKRNLEVNENDILVFNGNHYEIEFDNYLLIEYTKRRISPRYFQYQLANPNFLYLNMNDNQQSVIHLPNGAVRLDETGTLIDRFGMVFYGYWAWERLADLVPINYDPKKEKIKFKKSKGKGRGELLTNR